MAATRNPADPDPPDNQPADEGGYTEPADTSYDDGPGVEQGNLPHESDPDYQ